MARRRRRGGRRSKAFPLSAALPLVPAIPSVLGAGYTWDQRMRGAAYQLFGYHTTEGRFHTAVVGRQIGLAVAAVIGHKIANKTINRYIPKWFPVRL